ncbi:uncharacterized mitochondrial protein AtMg00810-like [Rutidosis leptorrhynchoides]|uniref:uncharacterized mitochondrial protein AtMg00810-like n=1 Tax=Rutidosis leptorrhynchoides TaxID=125765 RepID=UPI003A9920A3
MIPNNTEFQKLIRKLIYLTHTRPDISYSVQTLSQHIYAPLESYVKAAFLILRYLKRSPSKGIHIAKSPGVFSLTNYSDADWGKRLINRRSATAYCLFMCGSLISWKSKKQPTISRSSTESKYRALAATTCEIDWVLKLLSDFGLKDLLRAEL